MSDTIDFIGNVVYKGDVIFFKSGGRYPVESLGVIDSFTKGGNPRCYILKTSRSYGYYTGSEGKPVAVTSSFVKVDANSIKWVKDAVEELLT